MRSSMKLLRIKGVQETVCYRKPFMLKIAESYPLTPFSTIKGMLHAVLGATSYIPFGISIQGDYETAYVDYQTHFLLKAAKEEILMLNTSGLPVTTPTFTNKQLTQAPLYVHTLYNLELVFHIRAEETILNELYTRISELAAPLHLGRSEDLFRLDSVEFVDAEIGDVEDTPYTQFVPIQEETLEYQGDLPIYRLPTRYDMVEGRRKWKYIQTKLVPAHSVHDDVYVDADGYSVFLLEG